MRHKSEPLGPLPLTMPNRSLEQVFAAEGAFVLRTARRLGAGAAEAEDVTQQVFLVLHRRPDLLNSEAAIRSVLFGIVRRVVADQRKRSARRPTEELPEVPTPPQQERSLRLSEARQMLDAALDRLDAAKREVFVLYELEGLTMREVAELLGIPLQTAYTRLHAARDQVKKFLTSMSKREEHDHRSRVFYRLQGEQI